MSTDMLERLAAANPMPDGAAKPEGLLSATALRDAIGERRTGVRTQPKIDKTQPPQRRWNGLLVAAAAFAAILIVGIGLAFALRSGGKGQPADRPVPTTTTAPATTTTQPTPPTTSAVAVVGGPIADPAEGAGLFAEAFNEQDFEALSRLVEAEATIDMTGVDPGGLDAYTSFWWHLNTTKEFSNCRLRPTSAGTSVACSQRWTSDLFVASGLDEWKGTFSYTVDDGYITSLSDVVVSATDLGEWLDFTEGLDAHILENDPAAYARTHSGDQQIFSVEAAQVYLDHYEAYIESRG